MAEGRMLKKNVSNSRRLAELKTDSARLLWTWMLPHLDCMGRFHGDPGVIKGNICPRLPKMSEVKIGEYLADMARVGLITLYKVDGDVYLQYRKFDDFQSLRADREAKPLPGPPENAGATPDEVPMESGQHQDEVQRESGSTPVQLPQKLKEIKLKEIYAHLGFIKFWDHYPRKVAKKDAAKAFAKLNPDPELLELIITKIDKSKLTDAWTKQNGEFIPYPATWLNSCRWEDQEPQTQQPTQTTPPVKKPTKHCDKCDQMVDDTVDYNGKQYCQPCHDKVKPVKVPQNVENFMSGIGKSMDPDNGFKQNLEKLCVDISKIEKLKTKFNPFTWVQEQKQNKMPNERIIFELQRIYTKYAE